MYIKTNNELNRDLIYNKTDWNQDGNGRLYTSEHSLILNTQEYEEIAYAQDLVVKLLHDMQTLLHAQPDLNNWLDIPESLHNVAHLQKMLGKLTTFGRFDWVFDNEGYLKLLEFNSETPMGWIEAIKYTQNAHNLESNEMYNPNQYLRDMLKQSVFDRLSSFGKLGGRIAIVGDLDDIEELDTFNFLADIIREVNDEVMLCGVSELRAITNSDDFEDGIYIERNGMYYPIDTMMNFYSIEWLAKDEGGQDLINLIAQNKVFLMNPISTLQLHSKGLFALIWYLFIESDLLIEHKEVIECYIPYSTFNPLDFEHQSQLVVQKKLNHREGSSIEIKPCYQCKEDEEEFVVFQEYVEVGKHIFPRVTFLDESNAIATQNVLVQHTIGAYCINDELGGFYTRLSEGFCSVYDATFVPTFIEGYDEDSNDFYCED